MAAAIIFKHEFIKEVKLGATTKRLTLLLSDEQIRAIKIQAAISGKPVNQWIISQLCLDGNTTKPINNVGDIEYANKLIDELQFKK
jgi:uncharacterized protein (DUF1778 family)